MQSQARAVELVIDTDIDVLLSTATSYVLLATINGFEDIVLNDTGLNEFDFGFAGVAGIEGLPDGYYRLHYLIDLTRPDEAMVFFINSMSGASVSGDQRQTFAAPGKKEQQTDRNTCQKNAEPFQRMKF